MRLAAVIMSALMLSRLATETPGAATAIPEPIVPIHDKLKDLHLTTALVRDGQPAIAMDGAPRYQGVARLPMSQHSQ